MQFTQDNTQGFSDAELAQMNHEFVMGMVLEDETDTDTYQQKKQSVAECILRRHSGLPYRA
jgi:hypothetical protein